MKTIVIILSIGLVYGQAPYPPSGWRPQGQPFTLPSRQQQVSQEYGAPIQPPATQYLPNYQPARTFAETNTASNQLQPDYGAPFVSSRPINQANQNTRIQTNYQPARNFAESNTASNQVQPDYGTPFVSSQPTNQADQNTRIQTNYNQPLPSKSSQNSQGNQQNRNQFKQQNNQNGVPQFDQQSSNQFGRFSQRDRQNSFAENVNFRNNAVGQQQSFDSIEFGQDQVDEFGESKQFLGQNENLGDELSTTISTPSRQYGAAPTVKPLKKGSKRQERTTLRPRTTTEKNDEEEEDGDSTDQPNVAVATAVARGQYYILQPDGRLQRVIYMTSRDPKDEKNNAVTAQLMYENVEPLQGPIFSYNDEPLVRLN